MKATRDEQTFTMAGVQWSGTYPLEELPKWLAFYRRMRDAHQNGAPYYEAAVTALEGIMGRSEHP
ncbi:hypothetical protein [Paracoccus yeei]|uniref:hypothetical protein n=1 Tax=Paracoccus yeei TaxID=147645 RepID=UPI0028D8BC96|nr:hypothetical protein [Paracoccus yeei]